MAKPEPEFAWRDTPDCFHPKVISISHGKTWWGDGPWNGVEITDEDWERWGWERVETEASIIVRLRWDLAECRGEH